MVCRVGEGAVHRAASLDLVPLEMRSYTSRLSREETELGSLRRRSKTHAAGASPGLRPAARGRPGDDESFGSLKRVRVTPAVESGSVEITVCHVNISGKNQKKDVWCDVRGGFRFGKMGKQRCKQHACCTLMRLPH